MQEERAGGQAPVQVGGGGAGEGAAGGVGTRWCGNGSVPEILYFGRQQGVAG
jgi:hypothetical protein